MQGFHTYFTPRKSRKPRRPNEFAPRPTSGHSRKWVGIWVSADEGSSRIRPLYQRREFFLLCMILRSVKQSPGSIVLYLPSITKSSHLAQQLGRHKQRRSFLLFYRINLDFEASDKIRVLSPECICIRVLKGIKCLQCFCVVKHIDLIAS